MGSVMTTFCEATSLHGWIHLVGASKKAKIFWTFAIAASLVAAGILSQRTLKHYYQAKVVTNLLTTTEDLRKAKFPKIVVKNNYNLRQSFMDSAIEPDFIHSNDIAWAVYSEYISGYDNNVTAEKVKYIFNNYINETKFAAEMYKQKPIYDSKNLWQTLGQTFESLLLSLKIQNHSIDYPILMYGTDWAVGNTTNVLEIHSKSKEFQILSGLSNGVEVILDLETFDSADLHMDGNGLGILINNQEDIPLVDIHGFYMGPGHFYDIKIHPILFNITSEALDKFDYIDKKCVGGPDLEYSNETYGLSDCLMMAAITVMKKHCPGVDIEDGSLNGSKLACAKKYIDQIGRWKVNDITNIQCLPLCHRQENKLSVSSYQFPNHLFMNSQHFLAVIKKLFWSCSKEKTRFGFKRRGLSTMYPELCGFYDDFFYANESLSNSFIQEDNLLLKAFENRGSNNLIKSKLFTSIEELQQQLGIPSSKFLQLKTLVLSYCRDNLVKINVHLPSPYVTVYRTDEVMSFITFIANIGGMLGLCMGLSFVSLVEIVYYFSKFSYDATDKVCMKKPIEIKHF